MSSKTVSGAPRHRRITSGETVYSEYLDGAGGNYEWRARADVTDGFVGISQFEDGKVKDRVLLTPAQWRRIVAFVEAHRVR